MRGDSPRWGLCAAAFSPDVHFASPMAVRGRSPRAVDRDHGRPMIFLLISSRPEIISLFQRLVGLLGEVESQLQCRISGSKTLNAQIPTLCQDVVTKPRFILPCRGAELSELSKSAAASGCSGFSVSLA